MKPEEFESDWRNKGFASFETQALRPHQASTPHAHPFDVAALVVDGEITLIWGGERRTYRPGDVFTMATGTQHHEIIGPQGVTYLAGRRRP